MSFDKIAAVFITGAAGSTCEQPFEDIIVLDRQDSFTQTSPDDNSARGVVTVEFESRAWWAGRQEDSSRSHTIAALSAASTPFFDYAGDFQDFLL